MAFKDLGDWAELGGLRLPIGGRVYRLPPISAELGPRVQALIDFGIDIAMGNEPQADDAQLLDDVAERDLYRDVLGDAYDAMVADGVPWVALKHAAMTSIIDACRDRAEAERYWAEMGKAGPVKRPAKKAVKKPADRQAPTARKAMANGTSRGSTAGTTPRKRPAAKGPAGQRSSNTGS